MKPDNRRATTPDRLRAPNTPGVRPLAPLRCILAKVITLPPEYAHRRDTPPQPLVRQVARKLLPRSPHRLRHHGFIHKVVASTSPAPLFPAMKMRSAGPFAALDAGARSVARDLQVTMDTQANQEWGDYNKVITTVTSR